MTSPRLVLASASPRRAELLVEAGYAFDVVPADVDEEACGGGVAPRDLALHLARAKADAAAARFEGQRVVVLAADTVVRGPAGEVIGKPVDRDDARRILRLLSGTRHGVVTGYRLVRLDTGDAHEGQVRSDVLMRELGDDDLERFLDTGLWQGKAGAYGIQDLPAPHGPPGDPFIEEIEGELSNIVGLPMPQVVEALEALGVTRRT